MDKNYYLLATGSSGIDIPSLIIKVKAFLNNIYNYFAKKIILFIRF